MRDGECEYPYLFLRLPYNTKIFSLPSLEPSSSLATICSTASNSNLDIQSFAITSSLSRKGRYLSRIEASSSGLEIAKGKWFAGELVEREADATEDTEESIVIVLGILRKALGGSRANM